MFYVNTNSKGNQIKTKRYKFSLVSDTDVEKSCFSTIFNFAQFREDFQKQPFADVLQNRCCKNFAIF